MCTLVLVHYKASDTYINLVYVNRSFAKDVVCDAMVCFYLVPNV